MMTGHRWIWSKWTRGPLLPIKSNFLVDRVLIHPHIIRRLEGKVELVDWCLFWSTFGWGCCFCDEASLLYLSDMTALDRCRLLVGRCLGLAARVHDIVDDLIKHTHELHQHNTTTGQVKSRHYYPHSWRNKQNINHLTEKIPPTIAQTLVMKGR